MAGTRGAATAIVGTAATVPPATAGRAERLAMEALVAATEVAVVDIPPAEVVVIRAAAILAVAADTRAVAVADIPAVAATPVVDTANPQGAVNDLFTLAS